jgi:hypothetical protein
MADFSTTDVASKVTGPQQMNLGDMLKLGYYAAQTKMAQYEQEKAQQANIERVAVQGFMSDPKNYLDANGDIDVDRVTKAIPAIAPLTGADHVSKLTTLAKNNTAAKEAKLNFNQNERQVVASVYSSLGRAGIQDPRVYASALQNLKQVYPDSKDINRYADAAISNLATGVNPQQLPQVAIQTANQLLTLPQQQEAFAPKASIGNIGGASRPIVTTPSVRGEAPSITPVEFGGGQSAVGGGGATETPKPSAKDRDLIPYDQYLDYKGNPALANYTTEQKEALDAGKALLKESNAIAGAAKEQQANTRGVYENIDAASGSRPGQLLRQSGKWLLGNATQEMLNKNIARMAAASEVMGTAKTDQSRADAKIINGSDDLTAEALKDIVSRADATVHAANMFNSAYNKLIEKRGVNGYIQAEKLKSAWQQNYDVRMAQIEALANSNAPNAKEKANEIYATVPKNQREEFNRKWDNLHALEQGKFR